MNTTDTSIQLIRIDELPRLTHFHSMALMRFGGEPVAVALRTEYELDPEVADMLILRLQARYTTLRDQIIQPLLEYGVELTFDIPPSPEGEPLVQADADGELLLARGLASMTLGIGIGALRGMIASATRNTFLCHYPLPIFDLSELLATIDSDPDGGFGAMPEIRLTMGG